jgi:hypothetical protein
MVLHQHSSTSLTSRPRQLGFIGRLVSTFDVAGSGKTTIAATMSIPTFGDSPFDNPTVSARERQIAVVGGATSVTGGACSP